MDGTRVGADADSVETSDSRDAVFTELRRKLPRRAPDPGAGHADTWKTLSTLAFSDEDVRWLSDQYAYTALNVVDEYGVVGASVLFSLGMQGVAVLREQPDTFAKVRERLNGKTAVSFLVAYRGGFRELAEQGGLPNLLDRVEKLQPKSKRLAEKYPDMFPFLVVAEEAAYAALTEEPDISLVCFPSVDLSRGPDGIAEVAGMITRIGSKSKPWIDARGLDGLLLAATFPELFAISEQKAHRPTTGLPVFLQILSNNQDDLRFLLENSGTTALAIWQAVERIAARDERLPLPPETVPDQADETALDRPYRESLLNLACTDPHTVRLVMEKKDKAFELIENHWAYGGNVLPSLLYDAYRGRDPDAKPLFNHAWEALDAAKSRENERCAIYMLCMMARFNDGNPPQEPVKSDMFYRELWRLDHRVVLYLARSFGDDADFRKLRERGFDELNAWTEPTSMALEMIPGYDAGRFVWLLAKGYTPRMGETVLAAVDVAFTVWDVITLGGGSVVSQIARKGVKGAGKATLKEIAETGGQFAIKGAGREAVERAGKTFSYKLFCLPRNVTEITAKRSYREIAHNLLLADKSLVYFPGIVKTGGKLGKYAAVQWGAGMVLGTGVQSASQLLPPTDDDSPDDDSPKSLWIAKAKETLIWLNTQAGKTAW